MKTLKAIDWFLITFLTLMPASIVAAQTADPPEDTMEDRCRLEVEELHQFFQDWTTGVLEATDEGFERFASVTADSFAIIAPSGRMTGHQALLDGMRGAHGKTPVQARIWIENFELRRVEGDVAIVTYEEWQEIAGQKRGRLSTAVFRAREDARNGVEWLHVHETWLPR